MNENTESSNKIPTTDEVTDGREVIQSHHIINKDNTDTAKEGIIEEQVNEIEDRPNDKEKIEVENEYEKRSMHGEETEHGEKSHVGSEDSPSGKQELEDSAGVEEPDKTQKEPELVEVVEEEEEYVEEPPPDPTAPYNFSDSNEILKPPFVLRPDQIAEVEQLWELYQNYTPAYTDINGYITEKELVYMLKALLIMTYTPEQLQELIAFCVKPAHPQGHINYNQFLKMVTLRQRDFPIEDELRSALQVFDPGRTGSIDKEYLKEVLAKQGHKMPQKQLDNLIKEVDISNDGTIGIEDVVGTMCIDLNKDDILMLMASLNPPDENTSKQSL